MAVLMNPNITKNRIQNEIAYENTNRRNQFLRQTVQGIKNKFYFKNITISIIILILILILIFTIILPLAKTNDNLSPISETALLQCEILSKQRKECSSERVFCFQDSDCTRMCNVNSPYSCLNGVCMNERIITTTPIDECDSRMGLMPYLVGNPNFGIYKYVCKSVDPGIAVSNTKNLMCLNGPPIPINYLKEFPTISQCTCTDIVHIPATSIKRAHVECSEHFSDFVAITYNENLIAS